MDNAIIKKGGIAMAVLKKMHLGSHGTYMYSGFDYDYVNDGEKPTITVRLDGVSDEDALTIEVDRDLTQRIEAVFEQFKLKKWDGFDGCARNVLDGDSFSFSARFDDGKSISAGGYMQYPKNYREVLAAFDGLFIPLYEQVRPNRLKVMEKHYRQVILKDTCSLEKQQVSYPYISKGGNRFCLGKCRCTGGAAYRPVYAQSGEAEYMLVIYLKENEENWVLSCRMFRITDKGEVLPWGEAEIDPCFFNSDRLYGHIFTRLYKDKLMLGCFTQKGFSASGRDTIYYIDLYDIDNKLEPLANEKVEGPEYDKQWWTPDKIANFVRVADKYGFTQSKQHWEEMPNDPVFAGGMKDSCNHRFDFSITNNHDSNFYNTLISTPEGEPVGEYLVKGNLYIL